MIRNALQKLITILLCAALVAPCLVSGALAAEQLCSLQLTYAVEGEPMADIAFQAYRVADVDMENRQYHIREKYAAYNVLQSPDTWPNRAATMATFLSRDKVDAEVQGQTDENGQLMLEGLESGLYLIVGASSYRGNYRYTPAPFLFSLPYNQGGSKWKYDMAVNVKFDYTDETDTTLRRRAIKVWDDEGFEDERPQSVTVQLLRDGEVYATETLSDENNWRCEWTDLPSDSDWQLAEQEVGENYAVSVTHTGVTFVVTNTYQENTTVIEDEDPPLSGGDDDDGDDILIEDEDPPLADLPQTGMLWWPVAPLAMCGTALLCAGCIRRRKGFQDEK